LQTRLSERRGGHIDLCQSGLWSADLGDWVNTAQVVLNFTQSLALVVGAFWVYFKFIRGRTFRRRAEIELKAELVTLSGKQVIKAVVKLTNTGLSKLPLLTKDCCIRLQATPASSWKEQTNFTWVNQMTTPLFQDHYWVEPQETAQDAVVMPVGAGTADPWLAFRLQVEVWGKPAFLHSIGTKWVSNSIVSN